MLIGKHASIMIHSNIMFLICPRPYLLSAFSYQAFELLKLIRQSWYYLNYCLWRKKSSNLKIIWIHCLYNRIHVWGRYSRPGLDYTWTLMLCISDHVLLLFWCNIMDIFDNGKSWLSSVCQGIIWSQTNRQVCY